MNKIYSNNIYTYQASPEKLAQDLSESTTCRGILEILNFQSWIHDYISYLIPASEISENNKKCILFSLLYIINELKPLDEEKFNEWENNPDVIFETVITIGEQKGWVLDKHSALALCSKIVSDYVFHDIQGIDTDSNENALEQIISSYPHSAINDIYDPIWEITYSDILDEYECVDEIDLPFDLNDIKQLVNKRVLVPKYYNEL